MLTEDQLIPISALQHYVFCPRQCGLIHLEQFWSENRFTAEGRQLHERVHEADKENRPGVRIVRGLPIRSYRLGLVGQADVVEFHLADQGIPLSEADGLWQPFPVEYKRGKPKLGKCDQVQLCAQAICLEEMLNTDVPNGAFFYGKPRRRTEVEFTKDLRNYTEEIARQIHLLLDQKRTPTAAYSKKCNSCSLYERCLPKTTGIKKKIDLYLAKAFEESLGEDDS
ncbi:MAG: CRISPR-associated protein Cas4 [Sedimentisphaerales bacterium]|nr:CRISPR-associated protein Cas4 [Sedimentisphaerales bacterium]